MPVQGGISIMDKCPYCNAETRPGDNFCLNCGNRLLPSTPSPQQAQPVIGDATIPASEGLVSSSAETSPPAHQSGWADDNQLTIANTSFEPSALPTESSASSSSAAPVAQATLDKVENPAHLTLRTDNGEVLQEYLLEKLETSIGRAPNSDILLSKDKLTSRRHATITYENGGYVLRDERSANGTFINGQQLEEMAPRPLQDGDHIGIGEHELIFQAHKAEASATDIESMPTISVSQTALGDITYRTREDALQTAVAGDDFSTRSMNGGEASVPVASDKPAVMSAPETLPAASEPVLVSAPVPVSAPSLETTSETSAPVAAATPVISTPPVSPAEVTFGHLTSLPQPTLPDVAPLMAALATLDGQVSTLQQQLNATQESMRNHEADISQTATQLRSGVRRVSDRMDNTIADVARSREQLAWAELMQLMEDVMNNPRDIEYVTKLARKARELNKVFQIHQNVLNTLAECTSLLRSLIGEEK
jgi:pSer/pThr/pTyr-binding forkhead associated (FHA) protein